MSGPAHPSPPLSRKQALVIVAVFILLEMALVSSNLIALKQEGLTHTLENGWHDFAHGAPMRALAEDLRNTPLTAWLGQRQRELGWLVLGDLGPRVRQGCPDWLFLVDELRPTPQGEAHAKARARLAAEVQDILAAHGQRLLVVLVPDKSRTEADHRCTLPRPQALERRYQEWVDALRAQGVAILPLDQPLMEVKTRLGQAFDRTDTHWSQAGAEAAARAIAKHLTQLGFTPTPRRAYLLERSAPQPRWGDLVRLAGVDELPPSMRPAPDWVSLLRLTLATPAAQANALTADELFGDVTGSRLTLLGTSFSRNGHFADFLALASEADVANLAREGGGFGQSMLTYLEREVDETGNAWVIWEIPERVLTEPLGTFEQRLEKMIESLRASRERPLSPSL